MDFDWIFRRIRMIIEYRYHWHVFLSTLISPQNHFEYVWSLCFDTKPSKSHHHSCELCNDFWEFKEYNEMKHIRNNIYHLHRLFQSTEWILFTYNCEHKFNRLNGAFSRTNIYPEVIHLFCFSVSSFFPHIFWNVIYDTFYIVSCSKWRLWINNSTEWIMQMNMWDTRKCFPESVQYSNTDCGFSHGLYHSMLT